MKNIPTPPNYSFSFNKFVFDEIPKNSHCLDVGCWSGNLGRSLIREKRCIVDGIDVNINMLSQAKKAGYNQTFLINLNQDTIDLSVIQQKYDVIIFADILEHLISPEGVLKLFKSKLKKNGYILISLPNVAFFLNRLQLFFGNWDYREFGTLDKTHLRFYTIKSLKKMVESAGYKPTRIKPYNQFGVLRYINPFNRFFPSLLAYQILLTAEI